MSWFRPILLGLLAGTALLSSVTASAHAHLLSSTPADHATGAAPSQITLNFSESLLAPVSGAELVLTAMPGMSMGPLKLPVKIGYSADTKQMYLAPARALIPGSYRIDWHVVSSDTHASKGQLSFQVK